MKKIIRCWLIFPMVMYSLMTFIGCGFDAGEELAFVDQPGTKKIGSQVWKLSDLNTTTLNDGKTIPLVTDNSEWTNLTTPGFCWYDNDPSQGALYNWYAVNTGRLCPAGWRVATDTDWAILIKYLGGENLAGGKLKEAGTVHWLSPNTGATNEVGFRALPGGYRENDGSFSGKGEVGFWWTSNEDWSYALYRSMSYNRSEIWSGTNDKRNGYCVRCIQY